MFKIRINWFPVLLGIMLLVLGFLLYVLLVVRYAAETNPLNPAELRRFAGGADSACRESYLKSYLVGRNEFLTYRTTKTIQELCAGPRKTMPREAIAMAQREALYPTVAAK